MSSSASPNGPLPADATREDLWLLQADIDDATPELLAAVADALRERGALDVVLVPIIMKKGRPGVRIEVLARATDRDAFEAALLRETPSLGVRAIPVHRTALARRMDTVHVLGVPIRVKVALWNGKALRAKPEFDDLRAVAAATGRSIAEVAAIAQRLLSPEEEA